MSAVHPVWDHDAFALESDDMYVYIYIYVIASRKYYGMTNVFLRVL